MTAEPDDPAWTLDELLDRQNGVFRLLDVRPWLSRDQVRRELIRGRWSSPHRGIYVTHNGKLSPPQEQWVDLLSGPSGSALGGLTAASLDGLANFAVPETHLVIPGGYRKPRRDRLVVHYSNHLGPQDVHPVKLPQRTRLPRSLADAATWGTSNRLARAIILAGVQQRLVRPADLRAALASRGPCRRHALIVESIDDAEGGIASVPERDLEVLRRRAGIPEPSRQAIVQRVDGRWYLDAEWTEFSTCLEVHGIQHLQILQWDADLDRHSEHAADGRAVLQVTSYAVRYRKDDVAKLVIRALRNRGWRGP